MSEKSNLDVDDLWHHAALLEQMVVALTAERDALRKALKDIARQRLMGEMTEEEHDSWDFIIDLEGAWDTAVTRARAALAQKEPATVENMYGGPDD